MTTQTGPRETAAAAAGSAPESRFDWRESDGNGLKVFSEGDVLFDAMLADIDAARERVWLESYIFADDRVGREFLAHLVACPARGVDVRVRVDALGSHFGFSGGSARRLRASGVRFRWSHPWEWRRPWSFQRRNHRKLLVVDDRAAYLGGFNITELNSRRSCGDSRWRDTHVRLTGPIVQEAAAAYEAFTHGDLQWYGDDAKPLYLLTNHARDCRHRLSWLLGERFAKARERVWLTTPYFVPDPATRQQLCETARRGVDVRVLVPGKSDVRVVQWAARAGYARLLQAGARVFEYQPRTLHAKTILVDGNWGTIGTANFDYRSFFINYELNLFARSTHLNAALADLFEQDLAASREIRMWRWASRPLSGRLAELVGWQMRRWL